VQIRVTALPPTGIAALADHSPLADKSGVIYGWYGRKRSTDPLTGSLAAARMRWTTALCSPNQHRKGFD
jgi:hypothetical protein